MQKIIRHLFCQPHMARRIGCADSQRDDYGACVSVFDRIQFGTDPASVLNLGVANKLHMLLGTYQMLFYGALLIVVMAMRQWEFIGLGSIANMVLVGYSKDLFDVIFSSMNILNRGCNGHDGAHLLACADAGRVHGRRGVLYGGGAWQRAV